MGSLRSHVTRRACCSLRCLLQQSTGFLLVPSLLSAEEAAELQLQQAYLAFLWGRAALMGVEPQASATGRLASIIAMQLCTSATCREQRAHCLERHWL
jgi:hypothetical protein